MFITTLFVVAKNWKYPTSDKINSVIAVQWSTMQK